MNYGHPLKFGTFITPLNKAPEQTVAQALRSEELGYDLVTFQDHPYQPAFLRLRELKSRYDPNNVFRDNFNIAPQAGTD